MAKPLLKVHCITEEGCDYPVALRIAMDDGSVQTYNLSDKHEIMFDKIITSVRKSVEIGYQYKPPKRKSRIHRSQL